MAKALRFPAMSFGAEYLAMGYLMRRNILTMPAPPQNEGFDLICMHPDPYYEPTREQARLLRIQVKCHYATDCDSTVQVRKGRVDGFDFLIVVFLNIGKFSRNRNGLTGSSSPKFHTFSREFVRSHCRIRRRCNAANFSVTGHSTPANRDEEGLEPIAEKLGIPKPCRPCEQPTSKMNKAKTRER